MTTQRRLEAPPIPVTPPTEFFRLFLDSGLNHSSAYFIEDGLSLEEAQLAKLDRVLDRCRLHPDVTVLDVGCGWGAALRRAVERHGVRAVGLTVEEEQQRHGTRAIEDSALGAKATIRLQRWEDFHEPVDRILCLNAFENFSGKETFFSHCRALLRPGGLAVIWTVTADRPLFRVMSRDDFVGLATRAGFAVEVSLSLAPHYARTLDHFVERLQASRQEATRLSSPAVFEGMVRYYTRCAVYLRNGANDMFEFVLRAR